MSASQPTDQNILEKSLFQIMTLIATLNAATQVKYRLEERKAGHDPSSQEDALFATNFLLEAEDELRTILMDLRASFLFYGDNREDIIAYSVRCFNDLSRFLQASGLLQQIHQRLLSLYPAISEELAEEARKLSIAFHQLTDDTQTDANEGARQLVGKAFSFCDSLLAEI